MISTQIRLPPRVALKVVLQGIRVRFGRSIVTMLGVALGIAFFMSVLTGQVIKAGVAGEQAARQEVARRFNFFVAEAGLARGIVLGVLQVGRLDGLERRLVARMAAGGAEIRWHAADAAALPPDLAGAVALTERAAVGRDATALMVLGDDPGRVAPVAALLAEARHQLVFTTRRAQRLDTDGNVRVVMLERELQPMEIEKAARDARRAGFRNTWIVVIALCVTVIGIANAMLMSVTERFREIGTMKCLGALSGFVRQMFLIESALVGFVGSFCGALVGALFTLLAYAFSYGFGLVFQSLDLVRLGLYLLLALGLGVVLAVVAALYPARLAARMLPAHALRSDV